MNFLHKTTAIIIHGFAFLLGLIPPARAVRIADALGAAWYRLDKRHRKTALNNLSMAYGNEKSASEIEAIARRCFRQIACIPFEIGWSLKLSKEEIMQRCRVYGLEHLRQAYAKGRGVLNLTLHMGNWELLPTSYIHHGFRVSMVYRPLDFGPADRFFLDFRRRFGAHAIPKKKSMRRILTALKRKDCVGILLDQDSGLTAGVFADFFGHPACTNKGMALLALRTEAPVIPAYSIRRGTRFEVHIGPEIPLVRTGRKAADLQENTRRYNQVLEEIIRKYPEQWFWVHRRWKNTPAQRRSGN